MATLREEMLALKTKWCARADSVSPVVAVHVSTCAHELMAAIDSHPEPADAALAAFTSDGPPRAEIRQMAVSEHGVIIVLCSDGRLYRDRAYGPEWHLIPGPFDGGYAS
jgi:hypothetical protein